jgi:hypothetical protein
LKDPTLKTFQTTLRGFHSVFGSLPQDGRAAQWASIKEIVYLYGKEDADGDWEFSSMPELTDTVRITVNFIGGKMQKTAKIEEIGKVDET